MDHHLEIELKWALGADGYRVLGERLAQLLGAPATLRQDNRFFDSTDLRLRRAGLNLRPRWQNQRLLMTCKQRAAEAEDGLHRHDEWEEWLDPSPGLAAGDAAALARLPLPVRFRDILDGAALIALGGFSNLRLEFREPHPDGEALLCLDRTELPGGRIDFELEIETAAAAAAARRWHHRLQEWSVPFNPQPVTKFARFLALLASAPGRASPAT
jgi:uncharacterized protein YjbK